jgi:hypothetical protein
MLKQLPTLDEIAGAPSCAIGLSKTAVAALLLRDAVVQSALVAQLTAAGGDEPAKERAQVDTEKMLKADKAALLLRRNRQWIYRHARHLPFVIRISRKSLLCSEEGIRRWLATRQA